MFAPTVMALVAGLTCPALMATPSQAAPTSPQARISPLKTPEPSSTAEPGLFGQPARSQETQVRLDIRWPDGSAPKGAKSEGITIRISQNRGRMNDLAKWSDAETPVKLRLASGTLTVFGEPYDFASARGLWPYQPGKNARYASEPIAFDAKALGGEPLRVQLALRPVLVIEIPEDLHLKPGYLPNVELLTLAEAANLQTRRAGGPRPGPPRGRINVHDMLRNDGKLYHFGLEEGETWVVGIGARGRAEVFETVTMGPGETNVRFAWKGAPVPETLAMLCLDKDGNAVTLDSIDVISTLGRSAVRRTDVDSVRTGATYTLGGRLLDPAMAWPHKDRRDTVTTVVLEAAGYGKKHVRVEEGKPEIEVVFQEPGTLQTKVTGRGDLPLMVRVRPVGIDDPLGLDEVATNGEVGKLTLQPGEYDVDVFLRSQNNPRGAAKRLPRYGLVIERKRVRVDAGAHHTLLLKLADLSPAAFDLDGVDFPLRVSLAHRDVESSLGDRLVQMMRTPGKVDFGRLPAGSYRIDFGSWYEAIDIDLPSDLKKLAPRAFARIAVTDVDPFGPFGVAGLEDGDVIIGINGKVFDRPKDARAMVGELRKDMIGVLVQRGDERLELEIDRIEGNAPLGAKINPQ